MAKEINIQKTEHGISAVFPLDFTTNELIPQFIIKGFVKNQPPFLEESYILKIS
jgi:hypothetical protein